MTAVVLEPRVITLVTSNILRRIADWKISDEESNSDHSIIKYVIRTATSHNTKPTEQKFTVNAKSMEKYQENICRTVEKMIWEESNKNSEDGLDERLYKRIVTDNHTAQQIEEFSEAMRRACEQSFKTPDPKGDTEVQISPLVDKRTYRTEENHERSKKTISKNKRQCRPKREKQSDIP